MVETERPHRSSRRRSTSEFFLCFSSRSTAAAASSSSSMKISSKSILSPGRSRESSMSLSSSLSRRLRSNGSMKGGQASPMFPTGSKKKGSGGSFEPPEPSSPKVTCIGQVRVKSKKKHGRKLRTRSQRRGEVSFRKTEQTTQDGIGIGNGNGNGIGIHHQQPQQRWVHLSLSICETLRAFGAEFNCFVPCGRSSSSCSWSGDREKGGGDKRRGGRSSNSCGAVFARWLFALQESEEKGREAVVPAREEEERIQIEIERREAAREIEMEVSEEEEEVKTTRGDAKEEEEEGRQSVCIPPKNALLLMRSRSAPFRMSSLANRFWESPAPQDKQDNYNKFQDDDEEEELELEIHNYVSVNGEKQRQAVTREAAEQDRNGSSRSTTSDCGNQTKLDAEETKEEEMVKKWNPCENLQESQIPSKEEEMLEPQGNEGGIVEENPQIHRKDEVLDKGSSSPEAFEDSILKVEEEEEKTRVVVVVEKKEERRVSFSSSTIYLEPESESESEDEEQEEIESCLEQIAEKPIEEEKESTTLETTNVSSREQEEKPVLPECLLLMMCEPKLSMEVSKETWVCSNDFIRCRPSEKKKLVQKKIEQGEDAESKTKKTDMTSESKTVHPVPPQPRRHQQKKKDKFQVQPPRSSYSKVEQAMKKQSMATAVGQKLSGGGGGGACEPFVLKRCKSEPMRRTDKLSGEVCLWKKNKMESHHPPELPVGAGTTGVGF